MRIAPVAEVKAKFSAYLKASERGPVVVTRKGKAVAVLLSLTADEDVERLVLANSPRFQSLLDVARQQIREDKGIPHKEFWAEVQSHRPVGQSDRPVPRLPGSVIGKARATTRGKAKKRVRLTTR